MLQHLFHWCLLKRVNRLFYVLFLVQVISTSVPAQGGGGNKIQRASLLPQVPVHEGEKLDKTVETGHPSQALGRTIFHVRQDLLHGSQIDIKKRKQWLQRSGRNRFSVPPEEPASKEHNTSPDKWLIDIEQEKQYFSQPQTLHHEKQISTLTFSHDSKKLTMGSRSGQVIIWEFTERHVWEQTAELEIDGKIESLVFSVDGNHIVVFANKIYSIWSYTNNQWEKIEASYKCQGEISALKANDEGFILADTSSDGLSARFYQLKFGGGWEPRQQMLFPGKIRKLSVSEGGELCLVAHKRDSKGMFDIYDHTVNLLMCNKEGCRDVVFKDEHSHSIGKTAFSPDKKNVVWACDDYYIDHKGRGDYVTTACGYDKHSENWSETGKLFTERDSADRLIFSDDSQLLFLESIGCVYICSPKETKNDGITWENHERFYLDPINDFVFLPRSHRLLVGYNRKCSNNDRFAHILTRHTSSRQILKVNPFQEDNESDIISLQVSNNGRWLALIFSDGTVHIRQINEIIPRI